MNTNTKPNRRAVITDIDGYVVLCYENEILKRTIDLKDKSIYYAESAAENWESGILNE
jgi:hypothetical protein